MSEHFNRLTPSEAERLAYLMEEMAEAAQIIGKILRHGYESKDPTKATPIFDDNRGGQCGVRNTSPTNRELLEREMSDVLVALRMLENSGDLRVLAVRDTSYNKCMQYMHHQEPMWTE